MAFLCMSAALLPPCVETVFWELRKLRNRKFMTIIGGIISRWDHQMKTIGQGVQFLRGKMSRCHWFVVSSLINTIAVGAHINFSQKRCVLEQERPKDQRNTISFYGGSKFLLLKSLGKCGQDWGRISLFGISRCDFCALALLQVSGIDNPPISVANYFYWRSDWMIPDDSHNKRQGTVVPHNWTTDLQWSMNMHEYI
jgi:hypothetical protein